MDEIELGPMERKWGVGLGDRAGAGCPSASDLVDFVDRGQSAKSFGTIVAHLAKCSACREIVSEMRAAEVAAPQRGWARGWLRPSAVIGGMLGATAVLAVGSVLIVSHWRSGVHVDTGRVAVHPNGRPTGPGPERVAEGDRRHPVTPSTQTSPGGFVPVRPPTVESGSPNDVDDSTLPPESQQYCLVGSDGVFAMPSPNFHRADREQIEKRFADEVKAARDSYNARLTAKADTRQATSELNRSLRAAGSERDHALGSIYTKQASDLGQTLNLKLEGEAPYQVVEVHYRNYTDARRPVKLVVHAPWPGYQAHRKPYGWDYEVAYDPDHFKSKYAEWRRTYVAEGRPAFCGLEGHHGPVFLPNIIGSRGEGYADRRQTQRGPDLYTHQTSPGPGAPAPASGGYADAQAPAESGRSGYSHSGGAPQGAQSPAPTVGYTHSQAAPAQGGYTHSGQGSSSGRQSPAPGGYSHASGSGYARGGKGSGPKSSYTHQHRGRGENENGGL